MFKVSFRIAKDDPLSLSDKTFYGTLEGALHSAKTKVICADVEIYDEESAMTYNRAHICELLRRYPDPAPEVTP